MLNCKNGCAANNLTKLICMCFFLIISSKIGKCTTKQTHVFFLWEIKYATRGQWNVFFFYCNYNFWFDMQTKKRTEHIITFLFYKFGYNRGMACSQFLWWLKDRFVYKCISTITLFHLSECGIFILFSNTIYCKFYTFAVYFGKYAVIKTRTEKCVYVCVFVFMLFKESMLKSVGCCGSISVWVVLRFWVL